MSSPEWQTDQMRKKHQIRCHTYQKPNPEQNDEASLTDRKESGNAVQQGSKHHIRQYSSQGFVHPFC
jgi:hypothetical protein